MPNDLHLTKAMTAWRRHLHANPELSMHERETAGFVSARLAELGIEHAGGIGGHGVVGTIRRGGSAARVGLRADMDALPISETTNAPYASTRTDVMHACGHDGHTASLLGAAALLAADDSWQGTVHLVFQPAEEGYGGARAMLADGLLERFPMDRIFGYHNWPGLEAGAVAVHDGPVMAAGSRVAIRMIGRSGHAAMPHLARDPVLVSAHCLVALQSIVSRNVDPLETAVLSICTIQGGLATNQIPGDAMMRGTFRTHKMAIHRQLAADIQRVAAGVAATFGVQAEVEFSADVSATINHAEGTAAAIATTESLGMPLRRDLAPSMASEDFGAYLEQIPGAFVWIGNGPGDGGRELHNSSYDYNDAILPVAANWLAAAAKQALAR